MKLKTQVLSIPNREFIFAECSATFRRSRNDWVTDYFPILAGNGGIAPVAMSWELVAQRIGVMFENARY